MRRNSVTHIWVGRGSFMESLVQYGVDALSLGSLNALLALGVAVIFGIMRLINFAHGDLIMIGAYGLFFLGALPFPIIAIGTVIFTVVLALGMDRIAFRPLRGADPATLLVASFALSFFLQNGAILVVGSQPKGVRLPEFLSGYVTLSGVRVPTLSLITIVTTLTLLIAIGLFFKRTSLGIYMRAAAEDFEIARLMGVRANVVVATAFALSGALAGVAAILLVSQTATIHPAMGVTPILVAFVATIIGGVGSLTGAVLGGILLGVVTVFLQAVLPLELRVYRDAFAFGAVILILIVRPGGLMVARAMKSRV